MNYEHFLKIAIEKSKESVARGGFPVGAIIVKDGQVLASGISNGKQQHDPTSHAEIAAIREVCRKLHTRNLKDMTLYSSLEPCLMCFAACTWASIPRIVYACGNNRVSQQHYEGVRDLSAVNTQIHHPIELIHFSKYEDIALKVIIDWENDLSSKAAPAKPMQDSHTTV